VSRVSWFPRKILVPLLGPATSGAALRLISIPIGTTPTHSLHTHPVSRRPVTTNLSLLGGSHGRRRRRLYKSTATTTSIAPTHSRVHQTTPPRCRWLVLRRQATPPRAPIRKAPPPPPLDRPSTHASRGALPLRYAPRPNHTPSRRGIPFPDWFDWPSRTRAAPGLRRSPAMAAAAAPFSTAAAAAAWLSNGPASTPVRARRGSCSSPSPNRFSGSDVLSDYAWLRSPPRPPDWPRIPLLASRLSPPLRSLGCGSSSAGSSSSRAPTSTSTSPTQ
jgi:hypothetical protein